MRNLRLLLPLCALLLFGSGSLSAQRSLKKANKEYELYAFNVAIKSYLDVLEKEPTSVEALGKLADSYRHINRLEEAATYYQRAIDTQGRIDPEFYFQYGQTLKSLQRYDEAARWFRKYAETNPVFGTHYAETVDFAKANLGTQPEYEVVATAINSSAGEYGPAIFEDELVFTSSRSTDSKARVNNRLFRAPIGSTGALGSVTPFAERFGGKTSAGPVAYSPDGRRVAITKNNFIDGTRQLRSAGLELSLNLADVQEDGSWTAETPFPHNGLDFSTGYPSYSPDGKALYFASDRPDGFGGYDIYVSYRVGNSWSAPENMGAIVNTQGDEITPYYDGSSLYFASDWHAGFGGYDLFRAERTNERWTDVYNMGNGINSARDDYGFVYDNLKDRGFLVSNRNGGSGKEDIYRAKGGNKAPNAVRVAVLEVGTRRPIADAQVDFTTCGMGTFLTDAQGNYGFRTMDGMNCRPIVRKDGYVSSSFEIATAGAGMPSSIEVLLSPRGGTVAGTTTPGTTAPSTTTGGAVTSQPNGTTGRVVEAGNPNAGIAGVTVSATNQLTGAQLSAVTSASGDYALPLEMNNSYVVRYSKAGYVDLRRTVNVANTDRNPLSTISLLATDTGVATTTPPATTTGELPNSTVRRYDPPVATTTTPAPTPPSGTQPPYSGRDRTGGYVGGEVNPATGRPYTEGDAYPGTTPAPTPAPTTPEPVVTTPTPAPAPVVTQPTTTYTPPAPTYTPPTPTYTPPSTTSTSGTYRSGYAVQIGAYRNSANLLDRFGGLGGIGDVYYVNAGDLAKVRVGTFSSRESAVAAQQSLRSRGYGKAFIVNEDGNTLSYGGYGSTTTSYSTTDNVITTPSSGGSGLYYVRMGAFASKKFFEANQFDDLGTVSERPNGSTTIMLLGAFGSVDDARYVLQQVQQRGLPDAYVAIDENGTLRKVR